jgi:hypothetical protein
MSRSLDQPPPAADATLASGLRLGYACVNTQLPSSARTLRLANLTPARLRQLGLANLDALEVIVRWNRDHGIQVFRLTSNLIPFASHPANTLEWWDEFGERFRELGLLLAESGARFSTHPGQYTVCRPKCPAWSTRPSPSSSTTTGCSRRSASTARTRSSSTSARARAIRTPHARASPRRSRGSREEPSPGSSSRTTSGGRFARPRAR